MRRTDRPTERSAADTPSPDDPRNTLRAARQALSPDGRLVLAALSQKIDRQMTGIGRDARAELTRFVAAELLRKERAEGPVVLTAEQRRAARAPDPVRPAPAVPLRHAEPDPPSRSRGR